MTIGSRIGDEHVAWVTTANNQTRSLDWDDKEIQLCEGTHTGATVYLPAPDAERRFGECWVVNRKGSNLTIHQDTDGTSNTPAVYGDTAITLGNLKVAHCKYVGGSEVDGTDNGKWIVNVSA